MKSISAIGLSLSLLLSHAAYGVHAQSIRYNSVCLNTEHRGNPDAIDAVIFSRKPAVNFDHVLATPGTLVAANKEVIDIWRTHALQAINNRLVALQDEVAAESAEAVSDAVRAACARLTRQAQYLETTNYPTFETDLIAIPEHDIVFLMQWAERIVVSGDEIVPVITIILDDTTVLTASSCCGDLPFVLYDHMYWQKLIEAGWVAVDADVLGRVQPVLHTNVIGEKFHFYKTRYGVYFRETLGTQEAVPGDLLRIVKYVTNDPRHNESIHGKSAIVWLKFPSDKDFTQSLDGQYIPNAGRAKTASWVYAHDMQALFAELNS